MTSSPESVHDFFREHALSRPAAIAIAAGDSSMSYGELDAVTGRLARCLASAGAGRGDFVAIALPRSIDLVVAILAIAKAGAVYCALDVAWPAQHVTNIVRWLRARHVVTDGRWQSGPASQAGAAVIEVAAAYRAGADPAGRGTGHVDLPVVRRDDPCCVFFTSGTTGTPKGSVSPHRALTRLLAPCEFVRLDAATVIPAAAPVMWDAFALELWGALLNGGTVVLNADQHLAPATLLSMTGTHGVNTLWLTCSLFNLFVEEDIGCFAGVSAVMTGGERMSPEHARRFMTAYPDATLVNGYGPVESTVFASTHRVRAADLEGDASVPIGIPVPGTEIALIDNGRVVEPGREGEIYIGGDGLALGYVNDPDETARRFVTVTAGGVSRLMYRTGDLGSRDAEGLLHYHGRADRQLKISGHRVEPVAAAVREIYAEVIGGPPDRDASLYSIGGTSLDAIRICVRLSARLGITVPPIAVLAHPSAGGLAAWLLAQDGDPAAIADAGPAAPASLATPLYPTLAEAWLQGLMQPDSAASNCLMCWRVTGPLDVAALRAAAADVQRRHETLRVAYIDRDGPVAIPLAAPRQVEFGELRAEPPQAHQALLDALYRPFDLAAGPPWRLALVSDGQVRWFGIAVSHVAFDGWSESILAADLSLAYQARAEGRAPDFGTPAPTLRELHEEWQRELTGIDLEAERTFWRAALAGLRPLDLGPAMRAGRGSGGSLAFELTDADLAACAAAAADAGASLFTVLLAAFGDAVRQVTGQADFGVGVPFAQRNTALRSAAVACLMGMLCVRLAPPVAAGPAAGIAATREALHGAMAHAALPLPEIVRLGGTRRNGRSAAFRTVFAVQDNDPPRLELGGCGVEFFRPPHHAPVADLVTEIWLAGQPTRGATVVMSYRPTVTEQVAREVRDAYQHVLSGTRERLTHHI